MCVFTLKSNRCPQFESPALLLIPVGFEIPISFQGRNLAIYTVRRVRADRFHHQRSPSVFDRSEFFVHLQGHKFTIGTELMKNTEREVTQEQGSKFTFSGYKVSMDITQKTVFLVQS